MIGALVSDTFSKLSCSLNSGDALPISMPPDKSRKVVLFNKLHVQQFSRKIECCA